MDAFNSILYGQYRSYRKFSLTCSRCVQNRYHHQRVQDLIRLLYHLGGWIVQENQLLSVVKHQQNISFNSIFYF